VPTASRRLCSSVAASALASALLLGAQHATATGAAAPGGAAGLSAGGILQVVLGLAFVLALVGAAAWLLKRFSGMPGTGSGLIRIIGGAAVGQRERVVLVEVAGTWLLLGVAPGQVRTLHTMPKSEIAAAPDAPAPVPADTSFAGWLRRVTERRKHA